ncbi:MAG: lysophospholipid acyltransferase family protein [Candidatus Paceibacterota bacterium]|jgi:1-acyl-sn-glycerol-3-phosphate acyltransferase|nr:lysophospholipid acyltransferase family protein [Candidatus Paceibacterota bacterium]MDD5555295.1 lysophospholipid acyltransferase family protein [Candidatus Paceibacterota bacterium]
MNKFLSILAKIFLAPIVNVVFIKEVRGLENFPKTNFILAPNHQSYLDIIVCAYLCVPGKFTFIGQVDKGKGVIGFLRDVLYSLAGVIPLNRKDEDSKKQAFSKAIKALKQGYSLIIYPEGKRSETGEVQKGKWGVAKLFLQTGVPVVPLGMRGAFEIMPPRGKVKIKRVVKLNAGKPIFFKEALEKAKNLNEDSEEYKNLCMDITDKIMEEIKKLVYEN